MCSYTFKLPDETESIDPSANLLYFIEDDGIQGTYQYKNGQKELYMTTGVSVKSDISTNFAKVVQTLHNVSSTE
jgi:hypothetical protein